MRVYVVGLIAGVSFAAVEGCSSPDRRFGSDAGQGGAPLGGEAGSGGSTQGGRGGRDVNVAGMTNEVGQAGQAGQDGEGGSGGDPSPVGGLGGALGEGGTACADAAQCSGACSGCRIGSACVEDGAENPRNPCEGCDAELNPDGWSPIDGAACDDGDACTSESICRGGECVAEASRRCASEERCDKVSGECVCDGCRVGQSCIAEGTLDASNPCRICAPAVSRVAYSSNTGATCGAGPTECSGQDTCDSSGACQANHSADAEPCTGGRCRAGVCELQNPFDCVSPTPPPTVLPSQILLIAGSAPTPRGGSVQDGRYVPNRIEMYGGETTSINVRTFEFRGGYVQVGQQPYLVGSGAGVIPEIQFAGSVRTAGSSLSFTLERCDPQYDVDVPPLQFTATANGITVQETLANGVTVLSVLVRQ